MKKVKISENKQIHPKTKIGHIHLKVSNLDRSIYFYEQVMGFKLMSKMEDSAAFLSAGGYHHHIGLNTWESKNGSPPQRNSVGLYHFAILMPNRKELAEVIKRLIKHKWPISGASDHGVSEAIYLEDPDGNGIEVYTDKPKKKWRYDSNGKIIMANSYFDIEKLLGKYT